MFSARDLLMKATGEIYPVEDLAAELVAGIAANKSYIVAPRRARMAWWIHRLVPAVVEKNAIRLVSWAVREAGRLDTSRA